MAFCVSCVSNSGQVPMSSPVAGSELRQEVSKGRHYKRFKGFLGWATIDFKRLARPRFHPLAIDIADILLEEGGISELQRRIS